MNHIAVPASGSQAVAAFVPAPGRLAAYIDAARRGVTIQPVPADVQQAAWQHLHALEPLLRPASEKLMLSWLRLLAPGVKGAPSDPNDIAAQSRAMWEQCHELPSAVWCVETRISWGRRPKSGVFWPAAGELYEHLAGYAASITNDRAGCQRILAAEAVKVPDEPDARSDPAQQEAVTNLLKAWRADRADTQRQADIQAARNRPIAKATPINDAMLLAIHEKAAAEGSATSAMRAKHLRQKLGMVEASA